MLRDALPRYCCLAGPIALALALWRKPDRRMAGAALLSFLTAVVGIGLTNQVALLAGWWKYAPADGTLLGTPLDLWIGWAVLWGPVPLLVRRRIPIWLLMLLFGWADVLVMPRLGTLFELEHDWLYGEALALSVALIPAVLIGRWTADRRRLTGRVLVQLYAFTGLVMWLMPSSVMAAGDGRWGELWEGPVWWTSILLQLMALAAVPGLTAMVEFAVRGGGTPYPWDPPVRLVTTGPYAYLANPMQVSAVLMLGLIALGTHSWSMGLATLGALAFSVALADPHERAELAERLGPAWHAYDRQVRAWRLRRRPYAGEFATLYLARGCALCQGVRRCIEATGPDGLRLCAAEDHRPAGGTVTGLRRALYVGSDGLQASGLAAVARGFEHSGPGWAYLGWLVRLPLVRPVLQVVIDAMGGGPRTLQRTT
jgi:protein-S-isoprenylcysteine O-methyltransferase Ste14